MWLLLWSMTTNQPIMQWPVRLLLSSLRESVDLIFIKKTPKSALNEVRRLLGLSTHLWVLLAVTWPWNSLSGCPRGLSTNTDEVEDDEPLPLLLFTISTVAPLLSRRRDRRIGDILSGDTRPTPPMICPSIILTSFTLWGEGGGVLVPNGGSWLSPYFLLFCLVEKQTEPRMN